MSWGGINPNSYIRVATRKFLFFYSPKFFCFFLVEESPQGVRIVSSVLINLNGSEIWNIELLCVINLKICRHQVHYNLYELPIKFWLPKRGSNIFFSAHLIAKISRLLPLGLFFLYTLLCLFPTVILLVSLLRYILRIR